MNTTIADMSFSINPQALAVGTMLSQEAPEFAQWDTKLNMYNVDMYTYPWYNGREQGLTFIMKPPHRQESLVIVVFEHRNSDNLCALRCTDEFVSWNPPTIESHGDKLYPTNSKYDDLSYSVGYGETRKMVEWIKEQMAEFYAVDLKEEKISR